MDKLQRNWMWRLNFFMNKRYQERKIKIKLDRRPDKHNFNKVHARGNFDNICGKQKQTMDALSTPTLNQYSLNILTQRKVWDSKTYMLFLQNKIDVLTRAAAIKAPYDQPLCPFWSRSDSPAWWNKQKYDHFHFMHQRNTRHKGADLLRSEIRGARSRPVSTYSLSQKG